eukprot:TRINITY_DN2089_c0_g1_i4.p1 TRINITY_DN2089_c0_g1~~TRINITY_DN2089_c0_g1_i4.p1  ORF type:complete len:111 (+),score=21.60 TRINITY_DN2089_c0_g1_i4:33-365(+)
MKMFFKLFIILAISAQLDGAVWSEEHLLQLESKILWTALKSDPVVQFATANDAADVVGEGAGWREQELSERSIRLSAGHLQPRLLFSFPLLLLLQKRKNLCHQRWWQQPG